MKFVCPFCRALLSVENNDLGIDVQCGQCGEISKSPLSLISTNVVIGNDFVVLEELGRGGMGIVYLTHQISLDRPAALKVLAKKYADNNEFVAGFIKEARAAAKLNHPNIVQAYAVGEDSGIYFFAMEYIEGETMKDILKKAGKIPVEQACEIIRQIGDALDFAWKEQRLIHRDIKPDNIMIVSKSQRAKLADLGLARVAGEIDNSNEDEVMGTPQYISPEALTGSPMDIRSDIYSLGATFYHFLTGGFPFTGKNALEIAKKHLQEPLKNPRLANPEIPEAIAQIIVKMMEKSPDDRYQSAESLVEDLRVSKRGGKVSASSGLPRKGKTVVFHTSQIKGAAPTGPMTTSSTQGISTSSSKLNIGTHTASARIDTGAMRREQEKKARVQFVLMIAACVLALAGAGIYAVWKNSQEQPEPPPTTKKPTVPVVKKPAPEQKEPDNTGYTEAVAKILDFARQNPEMRSDILSKCDNFLASAQPPKYKCEREAMKALLAVFIPLDEKFRLADARKKEHDSYMAAIQRKLDEERKKKLEEEEKRRIQHKEEEIARLQKEREEQAKRKIEEYARTLDKKKDDLRAKALSISSEKNDFKGAAAVFDSARGEPDSVDVDMKEMAREFTRWADAQKTQMDKAAKFYESAANRNDTAIKTSIEIRPGAFGTVRMIKNGEVFIETSSRKIEKNALTRLPPSQYKKLCRKISPESNDGPYLLALFAGNLEALSQFDVAKDLKEFADQYLKAFIRAKHIEATAQPEGAARDKAVNEVKAKYGRLPQYKEALDGTGQ